MSCGPVLVVEDDPDLRETLCEALQMRGHDVRAATDGQDAWSQIERRKPAIILLDLMMPVMDGWTLRRKLLAEAKYRDVPVVVLSGAGNLEQEAAVLQAKEALLKPVALNEVCRAIERHMPAS